MNSSMLVTLILDFGLGVLLITTIFYCSRLSRRIKTLQDSRKDLGGMIAKFDAATNRALASVSDLQTVSKKITDALQLKIEKANFLADDLAFLIEKSNKLIIQLEKARVEYRGMGVNVPPKPALQPQPQPQPVKSPQSIENILHALSSKTVASIPTEKQTPAVGGAGEKVVPRTGAERELLSALKLGKS